VTTGGIRAVLLDIEGTTTPIAFVHERLFSYAKEHVRAFLKHASPSDPQMASIVAGLREEHARDRASGAAPPPWSDAAGESMRDAVAAYARWLMERDRKSGPLKMLQGLIWEGGYTSGLLKGEVYPDVPIALRRWREAGIRAGIFSSGSVLAQKLLFRHSNAGDLTPLLAWHFDTAVGPKRDPESYRRIASQIGIAPPDIFFLSDTEEELEAARTAGFQTRHIDREADPPDTL
jgi:enolase-phosphatase E1